MGCLVGIACLPRAIAYFSLILMSDEVYVFCYVRGDIINTMYSYIHCERKI